MGPSRRTSVVIPCHNTHAFVADAVRSAAAQSAGVREILVIDDGSTPPVTIDAASVDVPVHVIRTVNRGLASARNLGIERAAGEFVAFLDADDLWDPGKIARQEALFEERPSAVAAYTRCVAAPGFFAFGPYPDGQVDRATLTRVIWYEMFFPPSTLIVRRDVLLRLGGFRTDLRIWEDMELYLRLLRDGDLLQAAAPLTWYRVHPQQMTRVMDKAAQLLYSKRARAHVLAAHGDWLEACGIPRRRAWNPYRRDVLLTYYRRDFAAARRLLWDFWRDHPADVQVLAYWLVSGLPPGLVGRLRGSIEAGPAYGAAADDSRTWRAVTSWIARDLGAAFPSGAP